jgi:hypothetical protein
MPGTRPATILGQGEMHVNRGGLNSLSIIEAFDQVPSHHDRYEGYDDQDAPGLQ